MDPTTLQAMQVLEVYSFVGMIVCAVLALYEIDKARKAPRAVATVQNKPVYAWQFCPSGHSKILAAYPGTCPVCQAAMTTHEEQAAIWRATEAA